MIKQSALGEKKGNAKTSKTWKKFTKKKNIICTSEILNTFWLHNIHLVFCTCPYNYKWILCTKNRFLTQVFKISNVQT